MDKQLTCERPQCNNQMGIEEAHSIVIVLQKVTPSGYTFFQCEEGQEFRFMNWQHFYCSNTCMGNHLHSCLHEHHAEEKLHPIPTGMGSTIIHKVVLGSELLCKVCQAPLATNAYRFCATRATPYNLVFDESQNELGEWCCSLEHARQSASSTIQAHLNTK